MPFMLTDCVLTCPLIPIKKVTVVMKNKDHGRIRLKASSPVQFVI